MGKRPSRPTLFTAEQLITAALPYLRSTSPCPDPTPTDDPHETHPQTANFHKPYATSQPNQHFARTNSITNPSAPSSTPDSLKSAAPSARRFHTVPPTPYRLRAPQAYLPTVNTRYNYNPNPNPNLITSLAHNPHVQPPNAQEQVNTRVSNITPNQRSPVSQHSASAIPTLDATTTCTRETQPQTLIQPQHQSHHQLPRRNCRRDPNRTRPCHSKPLDLRARHK